MFELDYRPEKLSEFAGNQSAISYFLRPVPEWARTHLISGPSGSGKTTLARIIASQISEKQSIYEIDSAQDRGIDKIRDLIKDTYRRPLSGKTKTYIFDEFHQVTKDAQQALLKVTEEPPGGVYFVFCSTDPQKIIHTIRERCNQIPLRGVSSSDIARILKRIADGENIEWTDTLKDIGRLIVEEADGIPRRAVKLFEKLHACSSVEEAKQIVQRIEESDEGLYPLFKGILNVDIDEILDNLPETNYESLRIAIGRMLLNKFKKTRDYKFAIMMSHFTQPVDSGKIGEISLVSHIVSMIASVKEMHHG